MIPPRRWHSGGARAFSLVEMVAVIAITMVLLLVGVGLLNDTGNQARRSASDQLTGLIEQARTSAVTTRSYVILAVAEPGDLPLDDNRCRLGLFKLPSWPDSYDDEITAVLMSRWRVLENGVVLLGGEISSLSNPLDGPELVIRYGPAGRERRIEVHAIVFNPRGGLHFPIGSYPVALRIAEGGYRNGAASPNRRGDRQTISENLLKIGRVTARPYRIDG